MPRKPIAKKPLCHIHDKVYSGNIQYFHQVVCVKESDYPLTKHTDGKLYCIFHLPAKDKDINKFEELFVSRVKAVRKEIAQIKALPEEKRKIENRSIKYDFSYFWFPFEINFIEYEFEVTADFNNATFSSSALFNDTTFLSSALFPWVVFKSGADFRLARFSSDVDFNLTAFGDSAYFSQATFSSSVDFSETTFSSRADFGEAKFEETSHILFTISKFYQMVDFSRSIWSGYISFEGFRDYKVFLDNSDEYFRPYKIFREDSEKYQQQALLNMQNVRLEKNERISFHRVRLCPGWFINVDSRKMIFTDIRWDNLKSKFIYKNVRNELENLKSRVVEEPHILLEIASRQLAVNAEENNRYDEASNFRKMANEAKRLKDAKGFWILSLHWWYWLSSFYGESWQRALAVLFAILFGFALLYTQTNSQLCPNNRPLAMSITECKNEPQSCKCKTGGLSIKEAFIHSIATALFQNVEYRKPLTIWGELAAYLEKILAPLQAALLALAIRRKFMR